MIVSKEKKVAKKLKESFPNTRSQMRGPWKKLWQRVVYQMLQWEKEGTKHATIKVNFYLWMPIKPHYMKSFLVIDSSTWNKQLQNEKGKEKVEMLHRFFWLNQHGSIEAIQTQFMWIELKFIEAVEGNLQHP
jgi:hypothetical protein